MENQGVTNFKRLYTEDPFLNKDTTLVPRLCQQKLAKISVENAMTTEVEIVQRQHVFRIVILHQTQNTELTLNCLFRSQ